MIVFSNEKVEQVYRWNKQIKNKAIINPRQNKEVYERKQT